MLKGTLYSDDIGKHSTLFLFHYYVLSFGFIEYTFFPNSIVIRVVLK